MNKTQRMALYMCVGFVLSSVAACGDDSESTSDTDSGDTAGGNNGANGVNGGGNNGPAKDAGGTPVKDSGTPVVDSGMKDAGTPPAAPKCADYCTAIAANCTAANEQYKAASSCASVCATFPVGALADMAGNTLGCRLYHAGAAKADAAAATTHCNHAGITGGDKDVTDTMAAVCGEGCDAFCNAAIAVCTGANKAWDDKPACMTACKTFKATTDSFNTAATGDTFNCRAYHLTAAATDAMNAMTHCKHIKGVSPVCM